MPYLDVLTLIIDRSVAKGFMNFMEEKGIPVLSTLGRGTAKSDTLDYFGLEATEKSIITSIVPDFVRKKALKGLVRNMRIDAPGRGIAFSMPLSSVSGNLASYCHLDRAEPDTGEEKIMHTSPFELVVAVINQGYSDMVMDAVRSAGATGGTVIHAKGTRPDNNDKFFGLSIASEKEIVMVVCKSADRAAIMKAIISNAGSKTAANSTVLSLPVTEVVGVPAFEEDDAT